MSVTVTGTWGRNSTDTYQDGEDTYIKSSVGSDPDYPSENLNFGNTAFLPIGRNSYGSYERVFLRFTPFLNIPYAEIQDARLRLYCTEVRTAPTVYVVRVFQPWVENEATWYKFNYSVLWNGGGCSSKSDVGEDDGVYDRKVTVEYSNAPVVSGTWVEFDLTDITQKWVNKEIKEYGLFLYASEGTASRGSVFVSSEGADGYRPHLQITYSLKYYFSGTVLDQGVPAVGRTIVAHKRNTFEPIAYTTTSGDGSYNLVTTYSGFHYIVCLDDDAGVLYNDKILGRMLPKEF